MASLAALRVVFAPLSALHLPCSPPDTSRLIPPAPRTSRHAADPLQRPHARCAAVCSLSRWGLRAQNPVRPAEGTPLFATNKERFHGDFVAEERSRREQKLNKYDAKLTHKAERNEMR